MSGLQTIQVRKGEGPDGLWVRVHYGDDHVMIWGHGVHANFRRLGDQQDSDQISYSTPTENLCWRGVQGVTLVEYSGFKFPEEHEPEQRTVPRGALRTFRGPELAQRIADRAARFGQAA